MSDDTPTQRYPEGFPPNGGGATPPAVPGDAPTERFTTPEAAAGAAVPPPATPGNGVPPPPSGGGNRDQRRLIIALAVIGGVLLLAIIALLIWIATSSSGSPEPTTSPTPSSEAPTPTPTETTPSPTQTPTETTKPTQKPVDPPKPTGAIASFTASTTTVDCTASGGSPIPVAFSWDANGKQLWFGIGTVDASIAPYGSYSLKDTQTFDYQCNQGSGKQIYTITVQKNDLSYESKTITIREI